MPMRSGVGDPARALTVLCPVHPEAVGELEEELEALRSGEESPLAIGTTHAGRWVVVEGLHDEDGDPGSDRLTCPYLLFSANLDGDAATYLRTLCDHERSAAAVRRIWSHCVGYPAGGDTDSLVAYLLHNRIATNLFYTPYPRATVEEIVRSLDLRRRFVDFVVAAQAMDDETLMRSFRDTFGGLES
jgi:hypothetical protein